jgi:hypothetical protein
MTASPDWRFFEDNSEIRVACTPRFTTNSADAAIQYAEQGGGLTRVLAYQAADAIKGGRLRVVLAQFEQPPLPIHIVYPTSRLLSAKVRTFIDLVTDISDWHFGDEVAKSLVMAGHSRPKGRRRFRSPMPGAGLGPARGFRSGPGTSQHDGGYSEWHFLHGTTGIALARAMTTSSALTKHCAKQIVLPVLITSVSTVSHCPIWALLMKSIDMLTVTNELTPRILRPQLCPIALSVSAAIKPPWTNPRALVCGVASRSPRMIASGVCFE